ncbi:MAG TPA: THUMP domain-containing protein [Thermoanaerobaculia bacterium]|nr:THUMP domain-containing protein [Thermoanaerobaculia bacterium]
MPLRLVATCALGLEDLLAAELAALGVAAPETTRGAVAFSGDWTSVLRANWRLRTANRLLVELASWEAPDDDALAAGAERIVAGRREWDGLAAADLFHPRRSFAVHATSSASALRDSRWIALRVKDGLVDAQRRRFGERASVERRDPDLRLRVWLHRDRATLLLDTSGESLDHRGYRLERTAAPLREQLAAACVLAAGWDGAGPVVDPMCGSGTLLAEAGAVALGLAPGRGRAGWGFERLFGRGAPPGLDRAAWDEVRREPIPAPGPDVVLHGVDRSPDAIAAAAGNLGRAGLGDRARLEVGDAFAWEPPPGPGLLLVNPPHGGRLAADAEQWPRLGDLLKRRYAGWTAVVLAGGPDLGKHVGLRPRRRLPVRNGPLDARILVFDLY